MAAWSDEVQGNQCKGLWRANCTVVCGKARVRPTASSGVPNDLSSIWKRYPMNKSFPVELSASGILFAKVEEEPKDIAALISSFLTHLVVGLIIFAVVHDPFAVTNSKRVHYTLRTIEIHMPPMAVVAPHKREVETNPPRQVSYGDSHARADAETQSEPLQSVHPPLQKVLQIAKDRSVATEDSPHPLVLLSTLEESPAPVIKASPELLPASSDRTPKPELFTENATLSDVLIKPVAQAAAFTHATTSTPIRIQADAPERILQTVNTDSDKKASANIVSLSQVQMPQGTVVLPRVQSGGPTVSPSHGEGDPLVHSMSAGGSEKKSVQRIQFPPSGRFSVVMIGNSLEEQYPETASVWSGRLAYTVYLQLGAGRKWILQYSVLPSEDVSGAENTSRPEAPWPTDIVVPNLSPDSVNSDAILVHGVLTATGHFKDLVISFPPYLSTASFVLDSLSKWVFRPAAQNGHNVAVEVLVIIPIA